MASHGTAQDGMVGGVAYERAKASAKAADENKSCNRGGNASVRVPVIVGSIVWAKSTSTRREESSRAYPS